MKKILKRLYFIFLVLTKINWIKFFRLYNSKSSNVLWIWPFFPKNAFRYFTSTCIENDFGLLKGLIDCNKDFCLAIGNKKVLKVKEKIIFYNASKMYNLNGEVNHAKPLLELIERIAQYNEPFLNLYEVQFWENKAFMHSMFEKLSISHPKTLIIKPDDSIDKIRGNLKYPILYKPLHSSGSTGIELIQTESEAIDKLIASKYTFLLQEKVNMTKDLRVIFVGDEIVLHYWRINNTKEWKPTSTGHGSSVDFDYYPEHWRQFIYEQYKTLNIRTGAFDITWQNDDLSTPPLILEVSPSYMPNPKPSIKFDNMPYKDYKKTVFSKESYMNSYINLVMDIKSNLVKKYFDIL